MSTVIGQGVIEVVADATKLKAGISESKTALQSLRDAAKDVGETLNQQSTAYLRSLDKQANAIERQAATFGKTKSEIAAYNASILGVSKTSETLVARLDAAERSLNAQAVAARNAASANGQLANQDAKAAGAATFLTALQAQAAAAGKSTSELLGMKAAELGVAAEAKGLIEQIAAASVHTHGFSLETAAAKRELLVLGHELSQGNYKRLGGSLMVLAEQTGAATLLFSPFGLAVLAATALVGGFAAAAFLGAKASRELADSLVLTGNYAGQTIGTVNATAKAIAASGEISVHAAREFAQALIATGQIGPAVFDKATEAAARLGVATGKTAAEVAKDFARMATEPSKVALELNKSLNFLSAAQLQSIKGFEESGRAADAQGLILDALNVRLRQLEPNLGSLERAARSTGNFFKEMWDKVLDIGRPETIEDKIATARHALEMAQQRRDANAEGGLTASQKRSIDAAAGLPAAGTQVENDAETLRLQIRSQGAQRGTAIAAAATAEINKEASAARSLGDALLDAGQNKTALDKALAKNQVLFAQAALGPKPFTDQEKRELDDIERKKHTATPKSSGEAKAQIALDIEEMRKGYEWLATTFANGEKILEALHAAGLVDERAYYQKKRENLQITDALQESELEHEIARLQAAKLTGKDAIENAKKIVDAQARLVKVRENAATELEILSIHDVEALKKIAQGYRDAEDAAQKYLDGTKRANARDLAGAGIGTQERSRTSGRAQIEDRFNDEQLALDKKRRDAQANGTFGPTAQAQYDNELDRIRRFKSQSLDEFDHYYAERQKQEQDWSLGAKEALQNYADEARNVAGQVQQAFTSAFKGLEDALVKFITTGKLDFKSLLASIQADVIRISVKEQITGPLAKGFQETLFGKKASDPSKPPSLDTSAVTTSLHTLQTAGIDPAASALQRLQQAADAASASLGKSKVEAADPKYAGTSTDPTAANYENSADRSSSQVARFAGTSSDPSAANFENSADRGNASGEKSIADLFKDVDSAQAASAKSAASFGKSTDSAAVGVLQLAQSAGLGGNALALLPRIISLIQTMASSSASTSGGDSGGGGWLSMIGSLFGGSSAGSGGATAGASSSDLAALFGAAGYGHSGGLASALPTTGIVDLSVFDGAPRYHDGALVQGRQKPQLKANEVAAILMGGPKGTREEVLHASDPRHRDNIAPALLQTILSAKSSDAILSLIGGKGGMAGVAGQAGAGGQGGQGGQGGAAGASTWNGGPWSADNRSSVQNNSVQGGASTSMVTNLLRSIASNSTFVQGGDSSVTHAGDTSSATHSATTSTFVNLMQRLGVDTAPVGVGIANAGAAVAPALAMPISGARALGGPVSSNSAYLVNERRPELLEIAGKQYLMTGAQAGEVKPQANSNQQERLPVQQHFHFKDSKPSHDTMNQVGARARRGLVEALRNT